jgi:hypothetical protein
MAPVAAIDFGHGLNNAWDNIAAFVPKFLVFLVILLVAWLVAKALAKVVDVVLERVGFDRAVERGGVARALSRSKYDPSDIVAKLVFYAILLIGLSVAFGVFGPNPVSAYLAAVVGFIPRAIVAIVIVVVTAFLARMAYDLIAGGLGGLSYGRMLASIASVAIWFFGIVAALNEIGVATAVTMPIEIAVLAALAGIAVVGVGGGLVRPMQTRWERWLKGVERESGNIRSTWQESRGAYPQEPTDGYRAGVDVDTQPYVPATTTSTTTRGQTR